MNKYFQSSISHRKRKTRIALYIRISCVLLIPIFYLITSFINDAEYSEKALNKYHSRDLLSVDDEFGPINETVFEKIIVDLETLNDTVSNNTIVISNSTQHKNCTKAAIFEFPNDGFTRSERRHGGIAIHLIITCYCFWLLAVVCDEYFVPTIDILCCTLKMKEDVVGATFMAAATSSPELFINCVGTFITKGDLGVGTVVGSAVFNILAVPACCGLFAGQIVNLDWWSVSRDCFMYGIAVVSLIGVLWDGIVMWYEGLALVFAYIFYITAMLCNDIMASKARTIVSRFKKKYRIRTYREVTEISPLVKKEGVQNSNTHHIYPIAELDEIEYNNKETDFADSPWKRSADTGICAFILRWPITFLLWITIPDCRKCPQYRILTFIMCIVWIGLTSYIVAFLITVIGDTINIPDSVMGLTFLAAGTSVPEAVSSVIVTNQGHGAMGISSSISSNTFDILLCLGSPWFVKAYFLPNIPNENWIELNSSGLTYSAVSLLSTLFGLYISFALNKFRLDWKIGLTCVFMYMGFLIFASLLELNYFFPVNLPICDH